MDWAIVIAGNTRKVTTIKLTDWDSWEYSDFNTLNDEEDKIKWFKSEKDAIELILELFKNEEHLIDPEILNRGKLISGFRFQNGMTAR